MESETSTFYVYDEDQESTAAELEALRSRVAELVDVAKKLSASSKSSYQTSQQLVPSDLAQQLTSLELMAEHVNQVMEEKQRELKRARTVRSDYLSDVEQVQSWIRQAEVKVQDRSIEPVKLRENLREIQEELAPVTDKLERLTKNGRAIVDNTRNDKEAELIESTIGELTEQLDQVRSWLEERKQQVGDTLDAWQRFLTLHKAVQTWTEEKKGFLAAPLTLSNLTQARQRLHDYSV